MKKNLIIVMFVFVSLLFTSCRPFDYADKYHDVKWISTDPIIEFIDSSDNADDMMMGYLYDLETNKIEILCGWTFSNELFIYPAEVARTKEKLHLDDAIIYGGYRMSFGKVIWEPRTDKIYGGKYATIEFTRHPIE